MHNTTLIKSFPYLGGKLSYLTWLIPKLDVPVKHRIDVFGGSGVVLFNCPRAPIETYNDINNRVTNFFQVLRTRPQELVEQLQLTPYSRAEYNAAWFCDDYDNDIERARKFFIRTAQSIFAAGGQERTKGWASCITEVRKGISERTYKWLRSIDNLWEVADRLKTMQIENQDFRFIMKKYDHPDTQFYLDSPYDKSLRSNSKYQFDFENNDFLELQYWCKKVVGKVAISGYSTPFMRDLFSDFQLHEGPQRKNNLSTKEAIECLWTNY